MNFFKTGTMKYFWLAILTAFIFSSCQESRFKLKYEHKNVLYVEKESLIPLEVHKLFYVPAYSDIYYENEEKKTYLTVILSLRNISFTDTIYFDRIDYYGSNGQLIQNYIDKVLVLRPMESMEYIVRSSEKKGGTGANFVVGYSARSNVKNLPIIESIMMGNLDSYRFSFSSHASQIQQ